MVGVRSNGLWDAFWGGGAVNWAARIPVCSHIRGGRPPIYAYLKENMCWFLVFVMCSFISSDVVERSKFSIALVFYETRYPPSN